MAFSCGFYNAIDHDRVYDATQFGEMFDGLISDGIYATWGDAFKVSPGGGMTVKIGSGRAWFNKTWSLNTSDRPMTLEQADLLLPRIDAIILEVNTSTSVRNNSLKRITGETNVNPVKPTLIKSSTSGVYQYPLAWVRVNPNVTSITKGDIENARTQFVTGIIDTIDASNLIDQWNTQFTTWWDKIKVVLNDNVAMNLQNQIDKLGEDKLNVSDKATTAQAKAGTNDTKYMTPAKTEDWLTGHIATSTDMTSGTTGKIVTTDILAKSDKFGYEIGDIKLSYATLGSAWIPCDGRKVQASNSGLSAVLKKGISIADVTAPFGNVTVNANTSLEFPVYYGDSGDTMVFGGVWGRTGNAQNGYKYVYSQAKFLVKDSSGSFVESSAINTLPNKSIGNCSAAVCDEFGFTIVTSIEAVTLASPMYTGDYSNATMHVLWKTGGTTKLQIPNTQYQPSYSPDYASYPPGLIPTLSIVASYFYNDYFYILVSSISPSTDNPNLSNYSDPIPLLYKIASSGTIEGTIKLPRNSNAVGDNDWSGNFIGGYFYSKKFKIDLATLNSETFNGNDAVYHPNSPTGICPSFDRSFVSYSNHIYILEGTSYKHYLLDSSFEGSRIWSLGAGKPIYDIGTVVIRYDSLEQLLKAKKTTPTVYPYTNLTYRPDIPLIKKAGAKSLVFVGNGRSFNITDEVRIPMINAPINDGITGSAQYYIRAT